MSSEREPGTHVNGIEPRRMNVAYKQNKGVRSMGLSGLRPVYDSAPVA
jgi:hypothetical protein